MQNCGSADGQAMGRNHLSWRRDTLIVALRVGSWRNCWSSPISRIAGGHEYCVWSYNDKAWGSVIFVEMNMPFFCCASCLSGLVGLGCLGLFGRWLIHCCLRVADICPTNTCNDSKSGRKINEFEFQIHFARKYVLPLRRESSSEIE